MTAMKTLCLCPLFALVMFVAVATVATSAAESLGVVKQRMAQRLPAVDALKDRGAVGENNRGFLEIRGQVPAGEDQTVAAENADRSAVYAALAQQTGSSSDEVGRSRARQIAVNSKPGVWLQDESGRWYRK
jgi:uncharacterized protein YdbL (DUF1318 family)